MSPTTPTPNPEAPPAEPRGFFARIPDILSGRPAQLLLIALALWLVLDPLLRMVPGLAFLPGPSPQAELIGGNWTNVASALAAAVAAGASVATRRAQKHHRAKADEHSAALEHLHHLVGQLHARLDLSGHPPAPDSAAAHGPQTSKEASDEH
jgi:hypothetical protein